MFLFFLVAATLLLCEAFASASLEVPAKLYFHKFIAGPWMLTRGFQCYHLCYDHHSMGSACQGRNDHPCPLSPFPPTAQEETSSAAACLRAVLAPEPALPLLSQTRLTMEQHLLLEEGRKHITASGQVVLLLFSLLYKPFPADKGVL